MTGSRYHGSCVTLEHPAEIHRTSLRLLKGMAVVDVANEGGDGGALAVERIALCFGLVLSFSFPLVRVMRIFLVV